MQSSCVCIKIVVIIILLLLTLRVLYLLSTGISIAPYNASWSDTCFDTSSKFSIWHLMWDLCKILKSIYIDSALKKQENQNIKDEENKVVFNDGNTVSWKDFKQQSK